MSFEGRLQRSMQHRANRVETSPDAYDRILERARELHRPWLAPTLAVGSAAAVVALVLAFVGGDDAPVDEVVMGGPDGGAPVASTPIWPVTDFDDLDGWQRRVDAGEKRWLLEPREVARQYLGAHDVATVDLELRREDASGALAAYPEAAVVVYDRGSVDIARAEPGEAAMWFVVRAHDRRIPRVDVMREGPRLDVELSRVTGTVVVVVRAGGGDRRWLAEQSLELTADRRERVTLDVGADAPVPLLLHLRATGPDGLVGVTEMWVDDPE